MPVEKLKIVGVTSANTLAMPPGAIKTYLKDFPEEFMKLYSRMTYALEQAQKRGKVTRPRAVAEKDEGQLTMFGPWEVDADARINKMEV